MDHLAIWQIFTIQIPDMSGNQMPNVSSILLNLFQISNCTSMFAWWCFPKVDPKRSISALMTSLLDILMTSLLDAFMTSQLELDSVVSTSFSSLSRSSLLTIFFKARALVLPRLKLELLARRLNRRTVHLVPSKKNRADYFGALFYWESKPFCKSYFCL